MAQSLSIALKLVILTSLTYNFNFHITYKKHEKNKYYSVNFITHEETPDSCGKFNLMALLGETSPYIKFCWANSSETEVKNRESKSCQKGGTKKFKFSLPYFSLLLGCYLLWLSLSEATYV